MKPFLSINTIDIITMLTKSPIILKNMIDFAASNPRKVYSWQGLPILQMII